MEVHPLVGLLGLAGIEPLARRMRVDETMLRDAISGRPIPEWFARALVETFAPGLKLSHFRIAGGLTTQHGHNTIQEMDASTSVLKSRAKRVTQTKAAKATDAAKLTFAEMATVISREHRPVSVNSVQAWHKPKNDPAYRRIPDDMATFVEQRWPGIPRSVWPSVIPPSK